MTADNIKHLVEYGGIHFVAGATRVRLTCGFGNRPESACDAREAIRETFNVRGLDDR